MKWSRRISPEFVSERQGSGKSEVCVAEWNVVKEILHVVTYSNAKNAQSKITLNFIGGWVNRNII